MTAKQFVELVNKNVVAWFLVGLVMVLIPEGGVRLVIGKLDAGLLKPTSPLWQDALQCFGFILMVFAAATGFAQSTTAKRLPYSAAILLSTLAISGAVFSYLTDIHHVDALNAWKYDISDRTFRLVVPRDALTQYEGKAVILVCRAKTNLIPFEDDTDIGLSKVYHVSKRITAAEFEADCSRFASRLRLGDKVECQALICPPDLNVSRLRTLKDAYDSGCKPFDYFWNRVSIGEDCPETIAREIQATCSNPAKVAELLARPLAQNH